MKVMLILPPSKFVLKDKLGITCIPLGLTCLASYLEKDNHQIRIVDSATLGYEIGDIKGQIDKFHPDPVGVTATTSSIHDAY